MKNSFNDIPVILLAGGKSSRMGSPKGLLTFEDDPWLLFQLKKIKSVGLSRVVVVLGYGADNYLETIEILKVSLDRWCETHLLKGESSSVINLKVLINKNPEYGPFSSILTGLKGFSEQEHVFILPMDVPCPTTSIWFNLFNELAFNDNLKACVPDFSGHGGHPVLLGKGVIKSLLDVPLSSEEARLDFQLSKLSDQEKKRVAVSDPLICYNINTPEDWMNLKTAYQKYTETITRLSFS